jgi:hypothetical protein
VSGKVSRKSRFCGSSWYLGIVEGPLGGFRRLVIGSQKGRNGKAIPGGGFEKDGGADVLTGDGHSDASYDWRDDIWPR